MPPSSGASPMPRAIAIRTMKSVFRLGRGQLGVELLVLPVQLDEPLDRLGVLGQVRKGHLALLRAGRSLAVGGRRPGRGLRSLPSARRPTRPVSPLPTDFCCGVLLRRIGEAAVAGRSIRTAGTADAPGRESFAMADSREGAVKAASGGPTRGTQGGRQRGLGRGLATSNIPYSARFATFRPLTPSPRRHRLATMTPRRAGLLASPPISRFPGCPAGEGYHIPSTDAICPTVAPRNAAGGRGGCVLPGRIA